MAQPLGKLADGSASRFERFVSLASDDSQFDFSLPGFCIFLCSAVSAEFEQAELLSFSLPLQGMNVQIKFVSQAFHGEPFGQHSLKEHLESYDRSEGPFLGEFSVMELDLYVVVLGLFVEEFVE